MKKKTRSKLRNDLAVPFWIAITFCLLGAAANSILFHNSFFRALSKLNEEPIATITFKYKTAQRKFLDRVVWDRLRQNSPVYNGDTIHTADLSEATVWFDDGTTLDLAENTMAQVFKHGDGSLGTDLSQGSATVDSSDDSYGMTLTTANVRVDVKKGTKLSAQKDAQGNDVNLSVEKGRASLSDGTIINSGDSAMLGEDEKIRARLFVTKPLVNEKILNYTEDETEVRFSWSTSINIENLSLKIATDKEFRNVLQSINTKSLREVAVKLPKGTYHWKLETTDESINNDGETYVCKGKFQIIQALAPQLMTPAQGYSYQYRKKNPSLRFIWTESESATAYNFAISKSPDMSNPVLEQRSSSTSIIISTLKEGTYYWQVTPFYIVNRVGLANPSKIGTFNIEQKGELTAPIQFTPTNGEFVNKAKKMMTLSWQMEDEASFYKVLVSSRETLSSPVISKETTENYLTLTGSEMNNLKDGEYYWAVTQVDSEGNSSPRSETRSFYVLNGNIEQRTVFPPENYNLWKPLSGDTRFTWKTNLTFAQRIQIATDSNFRNLVVDTETNNNAYSGVSLDEGDYWWRITVNQGTFTSSTPGKHFTVVPEIDSARLIQPTIENKAVVRPNEKYTFKWKEPEGADYYRIKIYKIGKEDPVYDENFITGDSTDVDMEDFTEGSYKWEIQAYSYESDTASRRSSKLTESGFYLRKIRPVVLKEPANGIKIKGRDAIYKPGFARWTSPETFSKATFIIEKTSGEIEMETKYISLDNNARSAKFPPLSAGTYEWRIEAMTHDDFDVSADKPNTFEVLPMTPFDALQNAKTEGGTIFDSKYFAARRKAGLPLAIDFSWNPSTQLKEDVNAYILEIFDKQNKRIVKEIIRKDAEGKIPTTYSFENTAKLGEKGTFSWMIKAVQLDEDSDTILVDGHPAKAKFSINFVIKKTNRKQKDKKIYAQEKETR